MGIAVANESKSTVKNEALILLHALSSNEASKHDTCYTDKHTSRVNFPSSANVYACKSCIYFFLLSKIYYICLGPVQTSCLCRAELNSGIKFDKLCRATRLWHGSDSNVLLLSRQTKFINYVNIFWRECVPTGS